MDEKDLRSIIEQVLTEMNVSGAKPPRRPLPLVRVSLRRRLRTAASPTSRRSTSASSIW